MGAVGDGRVGANPSKARPPLAGSPGRQKGQYLWGWWLSGSGVCPDHDPFLEG